MSNTFTALATSVGPPYPPPYFTSVLLINDGNGPFADQFNANTYFISYSSITHPDDNIGNYSYDAASNWIPIANNTDPPSHFVITVKDFATDCNYYPTFDLYNNNFAAAWLETNNVGRLNLKYSDLPINPIPIPTPTPIPIGQINPQVVYYYPNISKLQSNKSSQSLPFVQPTVGNQNITLYDFTMVDLNNNVYNVDAFMTNPNNRGYEVNLPTEIKCVRFGQTFRETTTVQGFLGTAVQEGEYGIIESIPIPNVSITIYYGKTSLIYQNNISIITENISGLSVTTKVNKPITTDRNGKFSVTMKPGKYTFQINVNTPSINYSQKFV